MPVRTAAIVLAAGFSERMGEFKPLLPLGGNSVLERCIALFRGAGIDDIRVITGHRGDELGPLLARLGVIAVANPRYRDGMFSSVTAGVATINEEIDAFFVLPVDVPLVRRATILRLLDAYREIPCKVVYPCFRGKRGHPPLIAAGCAREISAWQGAGGLRACLSQWDENSLDLEVADGNILLDMDTPDDYRFIQEKAGRLEIATPEECRVLLKKVFSVSDLVIRHGEAVARTAVTLGRELNRAGCSLDISLLEAAALLHDIAKGKPDHAMLGAHMLFEQGFGALALPVSTHMDITINGSDEIGTAEVLYLADKMVRGEQQVAMEIRFRSKMEHHAGDPAVLAAINRRFEAALAIRKLIEARLGKSLEEVLTHGR